MVSSVPGQQYFPDGAHESAFARRRLAKRNTELQLNSDAASAAVADVVGMGCGEYMSVALAIESCLGQRIDEFCSKVVVETADVNYFALDLATVDRDDIFAVREEFQATGLVKVEKWLRKSEHGDK